VSGRTAVLSMEEVKSLVSVEECIGLQEDVFRMAASGLAWDGASAWAHPDAARMVHPRAAKMTLGGIEPDWWGIKMIGFSEGTPETKRRMQILALFEAESLLPRALVEANYLGYLRTGAAAAVATKHLARPDARVVGVLGTGAVARFAVRAHVALGTAVERLLLYSPSAERRDEYARELREAHDLEVTTVDAAADAVREADVLITGTASPEPVFDASVVRSGAHVNALGHRAELDGRIFARARTIADDRANAVRNGKLGTAVRAGLAGEDAAAASLGEVIAGGEVGRRTDEEITLFDSSGLTFQDIAVGVHVVRRAAELSVGDAVEFDTDGQMW
jgi:ornithine cyclodeaminase/alanine dehydrogenase-like protein (mu-crystallin family)